MQVSALHRKPSSYVTHQFPNAVTMWKNDYLCPMKLSKERILLDNEDLVYEFFRLILRKDARHLLDLFVEDAEIHQPVFKQEEDIEIGANAVITTARRIYDLLAWYPHAHEKSAVRLSSKILNHYDLPHVLLPSVAKKSNTLLYHYSINCTQISSLIHDQLSAS
jgi:hypothetical protein